MIPHVYPLITHVYPLILLHRLRIIFMIVAWCCATLVIGMLIAQILLRGIALIRRCMGLPPLGQGDVVEVEGTPRNSESPETNLSDKPAPLVLCE